MTSGSIVHTRLHDQWPPGISTVHAGLLEQVMSAHGWDDPTRSGQLAADIEEMVAHLVDGMHRNPLQRSFARFRVVVDDAARPVAGTQSVKHVGEHLRRVGELAGDVLGFLLGIAVVVDDVVARVRGSLRDHLDERDIADLTTAYRQGTTAPSLTAAHGLSLNSVKRLLHIAGVHRTSPTQRATKPTPTATHL